MMTIVNETAMATYVFQVLVTKDHSHSCRKDTFANLASTKQPVCYREAHSVPVALLRPPTIWI
jgi:hypothetical protein